jgi:imidazolonepropionase-like amidohydrolase
VTAANSLDSNSRECGGTGRRAGLRILWGTPWGFTATREIVYRSRTDSLGYMHLMHQVGFPILAGSDVTQYAPGFSLHAELAICVAEGLSPLEALQAATLNPAKMLRGTDSLGTRAPGKLADLGLLDADPLADITNTTTIRAVVANGANDNAAGVGRANRTGEGVQPARARPRRTVLFLATSGERQHFAGASYFFNGSPSRRC